MSDSLFDDDLPDDAISEDDKEKSGSVAGLFLLFGWLMFVLLALIFYFYYWDSLPFVTGIQGVL